MYNATFVCSSQHYWSMCVFERFSLQHPKIRSLLEQFFETRESKLNSENLVLKHKQNITLELGSKDKILSDIYFTGFLNKFVYMGQFVSSN